MLNKDGIADSQQIHAVTPSKERRSRGAVAIAECFQCIPCNPCYTSCKRGAMKQLININDRPEINAELCNGCGNCISNCPGLAIFVVDESYSDAEAIVKLPYEFLPLPQKGQKVLATDRAGKTVCMATVDRVVLTAAQDRTAVVWLIVPKQYSMTVRFFRFHEKTARTEQAPSCQSGDAVVCRCENVTLDDIRQCIADGLTTVDEIKRITRAGMGACSGRTCRQIIQSEIARMTGVKVGEQRQPTYRPPTTPIRMELLAKENNDEE